MISAISRPLAVLVSMFVAVALTLVSAPAHAAWTNTTTIHNAKAQVCKVKVKKGWRIKLRLNGRRAPHAHHATVFRIRNGKTASIRVRANRGRISPVKSLVWRKGDTLDTMVSEINGPGAGGGAHPRHMRRC